MDPSGKFLYVSSASAGSVSGYVINATSGALAAVPGSPFGTGSQPDGIAADGKFLYVANSFSNTVSAYAINAGSGGLTPAPGSPFPAGKGSRAIAIRHLPVTSSPPAITALTPSSATAGGPAFTLTVTGAGFLPSSTVQWNASPLPTAFVSATQVSATVAASLIAGAGISNITVSGSRAVSFTINLAGPGVISITSDGVVNAAGKTGGVVAPGEIVTISGSGFGPPEPASAQLDDRGYMPTLLAGLQALFDGIPAPLLYVQAGEARAVVPYSVSGRASTQLQVTYQGQSSSAVDLPVAEAAVGIFTADSSGQGQGVIVNEDGSMNSSANPAAPGSLVVVSATGEGQTDPPGVDGKPGDSVPATPIQTVTATIGGLDAQVMSAGGVPGLVTGFLQVALQIPDGVTPGDSVPIILKIGESTSQVNATMAVK